MTNFASSMGATIPQRSIKTRFSTLTNRFVSHATQKGGQHSMETITMTIKEYERLKKRADHLYDVATALQKVADDSAEGHIRAHARKALRGTTDVIKQTRG